MVVYIDYILRLYLLKLIIDMTYYIIYFLNYVTIIYCKYILLDTS